MLRDYRAWGCDAEPLRSELTEFMGRAENNVARQSARQALSAELNTLDRLELERGDRVALFASDSALGRLCAETLRGAIDRAFGLGEPSIEIRRIEGLQVHNAKTLREYGLKNLVKVALSYLANEEIRYQYDIILNPTGGYKGVVPFLTVLGMLYRWRTVYMFEYAEELIHLPPLPFSFDLELYERVRSALIFIDKEVAVTEAAFLAKISGYTPAERDLFMAFTEPFNAAKITLSPLAYCLLSTESGSDKPLMTRDALSMLEKAEGDAAQALKHLVRSSVNPLWRAHHVESWQGTDLLVLKQSNTAWRVAGFIRAGQFFITHIFTSHDDYIRSLGNSQKKDFVTVEFVSWEGVGLTQ
jgi:putative CRISPR-associated protein (TIGR02619 family)